MSKPKIQIYTDGGAAPNPGLGGWGAILIHPQKTRELSGNAAHTTNNRMELTAAIEALAALNQLCDIDFYTDSEYLRQGITQWMHGWIEKGKLTAQSGVEGDVKNGDLWWQLYQALQTDHTIDWHWVRGHTGNEYNERADQLATEARLKLDNDQNKIDTTLTRVYLQIAGPSNPKGGACGWAAEVVRGVAPDETSEVFSGGHHQMSVNQFSVYAALELLSHIPPQEPLQVLNRNSYLHDGITQWVKGWRNKGWQKPEKFKALWQALDTENQNRDIDWVILRDDKPPEFKALEKPARDARQHYSNS